jgi:hypothetical protein
MSKRRRHAQTAPRGGAVIRGTVRLGVVYPIAAPRNASRSGLPNRSSAPGRCSATWCSWPRRVRLFSTRPRYPGIRQAFGKQFGQVALVGGRWKLTRESVCRESTARGGHLAVGSVATPHGCDREALPRGSSAPIRRELTCEPAVELTHRRPAREQKHRSEGSGTSPRRPYAAASRRDVSFCRADRGRGPAARHGCGRGRRA